jgi:hypothetical protein
MNSVSSGKYKLHAEYVVPAENCFHNKYYFKVWEGKKKTKQRRERERNEVEEKGERRKEKERNYDNISHQTFKALQNGKYLLEYSKCQD